MQKLNVIGLYIAKHVLPFCCNISFFLLENNSSYDRSRRQASITNSNKPVICSGHEGFSAINEGSQSSQGPHSTLNIDQQKTFVSQDEQFKHYHNVHNTKH